MDYTKDTVVDKLICYQKSKRILKLLQFELFQVSAADQPKDIQSVPASNSLRREYQHLEEDLHRLEYYVSLLPHPYRDMIDQYYFQGKTWDEIQPNFFVSRRTLMRYKKDAVKQLIELYRCADLLYSVPSVEE